MKDYYVYILTNKANTVLYTGITSNLTKRVYQHQLGIFKNSFTSKYQIKKLIYYEVTTDVNSAITREKQIKSWSRKKKLDLINQNNQSWRDLFSGLN